MRKRTKHDLNLLAGLTRVPFSRMRAVNQDVLPKLGSCGKAAPGVELAVFDEQGSRLGPNQEGELYVRRYEGMFDGYFGDQEKTQKST